jgi:hypothetical protein
MIVRQVVTIGASCSAALRKIVSDNVGMGR